MLCYLIASYIFTLVVTTSLYTLKYQILNQTLNSGLILTQLGLDILLTNLTLAVVLLLLAGVDNKLGTISLIYIYTFILTIRIALIDYGCVSTIEYVLNLKMSP